MCVMLCNEIEGGEGEGAADVQGGEAASEEAQGQVLCGQADAGQDQEECVEVGVIGPVGVGHPLPAGLIDLIGLIVFDLLGA